MQVNRMAGRAIVFPVLACVLFGTAYALQTRMGAEAVRSQAIIRGTVRSSDDGTPLYGILVRARGVGKNVSTYVFTKFLWGLSGRKTSPWPHPEPPRISQPGWGLIL